MIKIFIGWDARETIAYDVCVQSILARTRSNPEIIPLKHRDLRKSGKFNRPWLIESDTGNYRDLVDNRPFSTEFSHTRFLVPDLCGHKGWALFMDCDMIFQSDIKKLWELREDKYAVQVVKHEHKPIDGIKMDGREQYSYYRKNWSSFILFNCGHPANRRLDADYVNNRPGKDLHSFSWLEDFQIGSIPKTYNWISGFSPVEYPPDVIHYTEGGPWFPECQDVAFADRWTIEYENYQRNTDHAISAVPTTKHDFAK